MGYCVCKKEDNNRWAFLKKSENRYLFVKDRKKATIFRSFRDSKKEAEGVVKGLIAPMTALHIFLVNFEGDTLYLDDKKLTEEYKVKGWWTLGEDKIQEIDGESPVTKESTHGSSKNNKSKKRRSKKKTEVDMSGVSKELQEDVSEVKILEEENSAKDIISLFKALKGEVDNRGALESKVSEMDRKVVDLLHAIEFANVNVVGGYNFYKVLQNVLKERRTYKKRLLRLKIINEYLEEKDISDILKRVKGVDNQIYSPRELQDIFKNE